LGIGPHRWIGCFEFGAGGKFAERVATATACTAGAGDANWS
jgi:hypothetical protein